MPGPGGFESTRMFKLADQVGELTEEIWEECGAETTLKNARRAYRKYREAKERCELDDRLEEEMKPTPVRHLGHVVLALLCGDRGRQPVAARRG